jgi:uncharacterized membrane protein
MSPEHPTTRAEFRRATSRPTRRRVLSVANSSTTLLTLAVCAGVALRLLEFLNDRSLWLDESFIAINLTGRSFSGLLHPLAFSQASPQGFLLLEKLFITLFGSSEYAFRAVSFISSLLALAAFVLLARRLLPPRAVPIAVLLFAFSDSLVRYAAELKPYETDVAVAALLWLYVSTYLLPPRRPTGRAFVLFALIGPLAVFFSLPAVFVLVGAALTLGFSWIRCRQWWAMRSLWLVCVVWLAAFLAYYVGFLRAQTHNKQNRDFFAADFMPFPPRSVSDLTWLPRHLLLVFSNPPGFVFGEPRAARQLLTVLAGLVFVAGCVSLYARTRAAVALLLAPIVLTLAASAIRDYPFAGRLLLFTVPALALVLVQGVWSVARRPGPASLPLAAVLVVALFANSVTAAARHLEHARRVEEIKPAMSFLRDHKRQGDRVYLFWWSQYAFKVYAHRYGFASALEGSPAVALGRPGGNQPALRSHPPSFIVGSYTANGHHRGFEQDTNSLRGGGRTWFLFSHIPPGDSLAFYLNRLDHLGRRIDAFTTTGAYLYLYDL